MRRNSNTRKTGTVTLASAAAVRMAGIEGKAALCPWTVCKPPDAELGKQGAEAQKPLQRSHEVNPLGLGAEVFCDSHPENKVEQGRRRSSKDSDDR